MVKTLSTMMPLGTKAPAFDLINPLTSQKQSLNGLKSNKATVIMFICNHCPYVIHIRNELVKLANDYLAQGISFIAINSNDVKNYPEDSPEKMNHVSREYSYSFPYLFDETQETARAYNAACTPDFFVFDHELRCIYRGQFDDSRPSNDIIPSGQDLRKALDTHLRGQSVDPDQKPSMGCNIKWIQ